MLGSVRRLQRAFSRPVHAEVNASLLYDHHFVLPGDEEGRMQLLEYLASLRPGPTYQEGYRRWKRGLVALGCALAEVDMQRGMHVGMGLESTLEVGMAFLRPWGVPYIPGSALKGVTRAYLARHWPDQVAAIFGTTQEAAGVEMFDAWYVPGSAPLDQPLVVDRVTPHHPAYYTPSSPRPWPWDLDDPRPVAFLRARGRYLVAVATANQDQAGNALKWVLHALRVQGVGARRAGGYGYATTPPEDGPRKGSSSRLSDPMLDQLRALSKSQIRPQIRTFVERYRQEEDPERKRLWREAIRAKLHELKDPKWVRDKGYQEFLEDNHQQEDGHLPHS
jgi:CRISPR-associated protein Cmr6